MDNQTAALIRQLQALRQDYSALAQTVAELNRRPRSTTEEIEAIPGRRVLYTLSGDQSFTTSQDGTRGAAISMLVSQDGPFVMTHYPVIMWYPNLPSTATNLNRWRPVSTWPLPDQQAAADGGVVGDVVDVAYEIMDGGSQRMLQNLTVAPGLISTPNDLKKLPVPTLFAPNTVVQLFITYLNVSFGGSTPSTSGNLHVDFPGYRIVNI